MASGPKKKALFLEGALLLAQLRVLAGPGGRGGHGGIHQDQLRRALLRGGWGGRPSQWAERSGDELARTHGAAKGLHSDWSCEWGLPDP